MFKLNPFFYLCYRFFLSVFPYRIINVISYFFYVIDARINLKEFIFVLIIYLLNTQFKLEA